MSYETTRDSANPAEPSRVEWRVSDGLVAYQSAVTAMQVRAAAIADGHAAETIWLLEHPPLYTAGTSAKPADLLLPDRLPVHVTGRGGQYTYHGPGQRIAYVMLDVRARGGDVRAFVESLEAWIIDALSEFNVTGAIRPGRVGVWVARPEKAPGRDDKIAALGIRISRGVSLHGLSINVDPDLSNFDGIVPCGIADHGVTSLVDLGLPVTMTDLDVALRAAFERHFGQTISAAPLA